MWSLTENSIKNFYLMQENETDEMFKDRVQAWFIEQTER